MKNKQVKQMICDLYKNYSEVDDCRFIHFCDGASAVIVNAGWKSGYVIYRARITLTANQLKANKAELVKMFSRFIPCDNPAIGVADLVGNVWEWADELYIQDGKILQH